MGALTDVLGISSDERMKDAFMVMADDEMLIAARAEYKKLMCIVKAAIIWKENEPVGDDFIWSDGGCICPKCKLIHAINEYKVWLG